MTKKQKILLSKIDSFKDHPFHVNNDESLKELANSIKENGLYTPLTVRLKEDGRYELISGHRRKAARALSRVHARSRPADPRGAKEGSGRSNRARRGAYRAGCSLPRL